MIWTIPRCSLPRRAAAAVHPNYIKLLRKALVKAGYGNIPVASLNFSGLEKGSGLPLTLPLIRKVIACIYYGDLLVALRSQTKPYENKPGSADALTEKWIATIQSWMHKSINYNVHDMKRQFAVICASYASVPVTRVPKARLALWAKFTSSIRPWATTIWKNSWKARTAK